MKAICAAFLVLSAVSAVAGQDCAAVDAAEAKSGVTPRRIEVHLMGTMDTTMTLIIIDRKWYRHSDLDKAWEKAGYDPESADAAYVKLAQDQHQTCRADGSATLDGVAADVFVVDRDSGFHQRVWIGHDSGLPLKYDETYKSGMHALTQFVYADVQPPVDP